MSGYWAWGLGECVFKLAAWGTLLAALTALISQNDPKIMWVVNVLGIVWYLSFMSAVLRMMEIPMDFLRKMKANRKIIVVLQILVGLAFSVSIYLFVWPAITHVFEIALKAATRH